MSAEPNGGIVRDDWTAERGHTNSSQAYLELVEFVESLIRQDAHKLIAGRADMTARLIVSQLAHTYGMRPDGL